MNKKTTIIIIISCVLIALLSLSIATIVVVRSNSIIESNEVAPGETSGFTMSQQSLASEDCSKIYNFNQLLKPDIYVSWSNKGVIANNAGFSLHQLESAGQFYNGRLTSVINLNTTHKYYLSYNADVVVSDTGFGYDILSPNYDNKIRISSSNDSIIFTPLSKENYLSLHYWDYYNINVNCQPILVDLTQMYGVGHEPTSLDELYKVIPKGSYFPYTDSLPVGGNGLDSYNNGYNDALNSIVSEVNSSVFYSSSKIEYGLTIPSGHVFDERNSGILKKDNVVGFNGCISFYVGKRFAGDTYTLSFDGSCFYPEFDSNSTNYLCIGSLTNNKLVELGRILVGIENVDSNVALYSSSSVTIKSLYDFDTIYLYTPFTIGSTPNISENLAFYLKNVTISFDKYNGSIALDNAYSSGYKNGDLDGYNRGYNEGSRDTDNVSAFQWASNFFHSVGTLFDIKIFGNVTIGTLIFMPLILGVVLMVLKFVR